MSMEANPTPAQPMLEASLPSIGITSSRLALMILVSFASLYYHFFDMLILALKKMKTVYNQLKRNNQAFWFGEERTLSFPSRSGSVGGQLVSFKIPLNIVQANNSCFIAQKSSVWVPCSRVGHVYRAFMPYNFGKTKLY